MKKTWHAYILIAPLVAGCLLFTVVPLVLVQLGDTHSGVNLHLRNLLSSMLPQ